MAKLGRGIYYRKKEKRYVGKCPAGRNSNDKIIYAYVYSKSYKEVLKKLEAKRNEVTALKNIKIYGDGSLEQWVLHFIKSYVSGNVKHSTVASYNVKIENHIIPALGKIKLAYLTFEQIQNFIFILAKKGISPVTIKSIYGILRMAIKKAADEKLLPENPCCNIVLPEITAKQTDPFTKKQQALLEKSEEISVILSLYTGIRLGEICALKIEDVNLQNGTLRIESTMQRIKLSDNCHKKTKVIITTPKSKKSARVIPMPPCIITLLKKHIKAQKGFLLTNSEKFIEPRTLQNHFKKLLKKCEIESAKNTNFHTLRHTFATRCLESGMDIKTLSEILGHSNASVTLNIYCHSCNDHKKECMSKLEFIYVA